MEAEAEAEMLGRREGRSGRFSFGWGWVALISYGSLVLVTVGGVRGLFQFGDFEQGACRRAILVFFLLIYGFVHSFTAYFQSWIWDGYSAWLVHCDLLLLFLPSFIKDALR